MTGDELHTWRRTHKITQETLAKELGCNRTSVVRWEARRTDHVPAGVVSRLATLERALETTKPVPMLDPVTAAQYPQYRLYVRENGKWSVLPDHPKRVMTGFQNQLVPLAVLKTDEYKAAVEQARARAAASTKNFNEVTRPAVRAAVLAKYGPR